ncbi:cation transport protein-domain-containing protein [Kockovaella imperatae]|uniref:Potassium transport protein n=1 Tax=Kockovaella imperatae TaxID=4999 RepID=A0A1Y1USL3_9TREE|nr:cation transport protein-domain-containing protein [Kockovaella imperatae]ORX40999.1 cation transport protein-domain-containing protein [Kockovaella imperatae]
MEHQNSDEGSETTGKGLFTRIPLHPRLAKALQICSEQLNFYRVHVIYFTITPLVFSAILWASATDGFTIEYIDSLFICMSAMTVTGLATINLSTLSGFQQTLLLILMLIGNPPVISLVTIIVRRHFFRSAFRHAIHERQKREKSLSSGVTNTLSRVTTRPITAIRKRFSVHLKPSEKPVVERHGTEHVGGGHSDPSVELKSVQASDPPTPRKSKFHRGGKKVNNISKAMIKRVEGGGVGLINPMGWYDAERAETPSPSPAQPTHSSGSTTRGGDRSDEEVFVSDDEGENPPPANGNVNDIQAPKPVKPISPVLKGTGEHIRSPTPPSITIPTILTGSHDDAPVVESPQHEVPLERQPYAGRVLSDDAFPRSRTIAFDDPDDGFSHDHQAITTGREGGYMPRTATYRSQTEGRVPMTATSSLPRTHSLLPSANRKKDTRLSGFGGFPTPFELIRSAVEHVFPKASSGLGKSLTMPRTSTIGGRGTIAPGDSTTREVPYISFTATVGRNSRFTGLTEEQMDELGGVEYRALKVLLFIVIGYIICFQMAAFVIIAPSVAAHGRYQYVFNEQPRQVGIPWFAFWQAVSAFTNTGMSLVDQSMVPFQKAYAMIITLIVLILAGNTAFPIFLRIIVWCIYKSVPRRSRVKETLKFLLDHPRRCFIYLFPTTQTWVLACVVLSLTLTDWVSFLVLDIGTPAIEAIPVGTRIADAFLQSAAVRAAGFGIVPLSVLAPAVQVLYVIMMYISVYPIALSVRATNVYEERSLGLYNEEDEDREMNEAEDGKGAQAVAKYLGWHARRQLAFDIWWLGFALWVICIIERGPLNDANNEGWLNIFTIIFELVSGYGTVGLSLGTPFTNYSLSGSFRKLSKLVLVVVMLRGRHRGLPVAIDRAVMLPRDFTVAEEQAFEERVDRIRRMSRQGSFDVPEDFLGQLRRGRSTTNMSSGDAYQQPGTATVTPTSAPWNRERSSSPPQGMKRHSRTGSHSASGHTGTQVSHAPPSPSVLHFLPSRNSSERQRFSSPAVHVQTAGGSTPVPVTHGHGLLSPVEESTMSRTNTATGEEVHRSSV